MEQNSTRNLFIKFLYRETSSTETSRVKQLLATDRAAFEEMEGLRKAFRQLPKVKFKPTNETLSKILTYSRFSFVES